MYYLSSENKDADQLRGYRETDLRLRFRICKKPVVNNEAQIWILPAQCTIYEKMTNNPYMYVFKRQIKIKGQKLQNESIIAEEPNIIIWMAQGVTQ